MDEAVCCECRERALSLLDRRAHSVAELRRKLRKRGYAPEIVTQVLADLQRWQLLDDRRFADEYCVYRCGGSRPYGRRRVLAELSRRGIAPEIAAEALDAFEHTEHSTEFERAFAAGRRKWESLCARETVPVKRREKLVRFLAGRGFASGACYAVLEKLQSEDGCTEFEE